MRDPWRPNREERQEIWNRANRGEVTRNDVFGLVYMCDHLEDQRALTWGDIQNAAKAVAERPVQRQRWEPVHPRVFAARVACHGDGMWCGYLPTHSCQRD